MFHRQTTDLYDQVAFLDEGFDLDRQAHRRELLKAMGLAGLVLSAGGVLAYHTIAQSATEHLNGDLCPSGVPAPTHIAVLVDTTDTPSDPQRRTLEASLRHRVDALAVGARLSLYLLTPDRTKPVVTELFARCKPKDGVHANGMTETKPLFEKRYREQFQAPFEAALAKLKDARTSETSPLLEAMHAIIKQPAFSRAQSRRLEIWSDMLQHSPGVMTHLKPGYSVDQLKSTLYRTDMTELAGADVRIYQFKSPKYPQLQTEAHGQFWGAYFQALKVGYYERSRL